jgi:pteridine reductase
LRRVQLLGRWALVTGSAKRVGRSIALALAERGANVVVHYNTSAADADATVGELRQRGVEAVALSADLGQTADVIDLAREAEARTGGISILVNNASNYFRVRFDDLDESVWDASLDVNLKAPFLLAWHLGRAMRGRGGGRIVNLADWAGERPYNDYLPYCISKAGIICLTKALAKALAPSVLVNAISPGPVMPPEDLSDAERQAIMRATPLRRLGTPEDVARCVRFLAEEADFSTGAVYLVDGGRLIA